MNKLIVWVEIPSADFKSLSSMTPGQFFDGNEACSDFFE